MCLQPSVKVHLCPVLVHWKIQYWSSEQLNNYTKGHEIQMQHNCRYIYGIIYYFCYHIFAEYYCWDFADYDYPNFADNWKCKHINGIVALLCFCQFQILIPSVIRRLNFSPTNQNTLCSQHALLSVWAVSSKSCCGTSWKYQQNSSWWEEGEGGEIKNNERKIEDKDSNC